MNSGSTPRRTRAGRGGGRPGRLAGAGAGGDRRPRAGPAAALRQTAPPAGGAEMSLADVAALARPSVVDILVDNGSGGSGVRVGAGVITNAHVVEGTPGRST